MTQQQPQDHTLLAALTGSAVARLGEKQRPPSGTAVVTDGVPRGAPAAAAAAPPLANKRGLRLLSLEGALASPHLCVCMTYACVCAASLERPIISAEVSKRPPSVCVPVAAVHNIVLRCRLPSVRQVVALRVSRWCGS